VAFTSCFSIVTPTISKSYTCPDVEFIFARGSGESLNDKNYSAWKKSITKQIKNTKLKYNFYELGTKTYNKSKYPAIAVGVDNLQKISTSLSAFSKKDSSKFNKSVKKGISELSGRIKAISSSCKKTKFVIGGYSQGAMVISKALSKLNSKKIIFAATFGDPNLYLPEGYGVNPPACRGKNLSAYRYYAPNCRTRSGRLGAKKPYVDTGYSGKVGLWCTKKDLFCSNYFSLSDHLSYATNGLYQDAAKVIRKKLAKAYKNKVSSSSSAKTSKRNTAIVIDSSGSMSGMINTYKKEALKLAKKTIESGGQIALFEYRDLADPYQTKMLCDFGCSYKKFKQKLDSIKTDGGGDEPESALSASLYAMNKLKWQKGATKSIVVLTDATYLSPDRDKTTLKKVRQRSLEIDPVNIYTITPEEIVSSYEELTSSTGGKSFALGDEMSVLTDTLLDRPEINFPFEEYSGGTDDVFTFSVVTDDENIEKYEWDLDMDGEFEKTTYENSVSAKYNQEKTGYIQVRAINSSGLSSTASASITISNQTINIAKVSNLKYKLKDDTAKITFKKNKFTSGVLISVDGVILGNTENDSFALEDVTSNTTIVLSPYSKSGEFGEDSEPLTIIVKATKNSSSSIKILAPNAGIK